jgi:hypothetical protein
MAGAPAKTYFTEELEHLIDRDSRFWGEIKEILGNIGI